jgi:hypothetical protein
LILINLCPHPVKILTPYGVVDLPQAGPAARLHYLEDDEELFEFGLIKRAKILASELPEPEPDTLYVVSSLVRVAHPYRLDLVSPHDLIKDEDNRTYACLALLGNSFD